MPGDERRRKGVAARERITSQFTLDLAIERYFRLYAAAIRSRKTQGVPREAGA